MRSDETQDLKIFYCSILGCFRLAQHQEKRWESEIEGAGAGIVRGYYFASLFLFRFFGRMQKNERVFEKIIMTNNYPLISLNAKNI